MVERPTWQDDVLRQKERLATDLPSRQVGMAMTCILFGFFLPFWFMFLVYLLNIGLEALQHRLLTEFEKRPTARSFAAIATVSFLGFANFSVPALLVWFQAEPMLGFVSAIAVIGALLNICVVRSANRTYGLISGIPPALTLLWMPVYAYLSGADPGLALVALVGAIVLLGYFVSALQQNYRTQRELVQSIELAKSSSEAKSRFLSAMNHEIRTPLNTILGYSQIIREGGKVVSSHEYAGKVEEAARTLRTLIEDVLDLASAAEGQIRFNPVTAAFRQEINAAAALLSTERTGSGLTLTADFADDVPELGRFDPLLLRKSLNHLCDYTSAGTPASTPALRLHCSRAQGGPDRLHLTIHTNDVDPGEVATWPAIGVMPHDVELAVTFVDKIADVMGAQSRFLTGPEGRRAATLDLPFIAIADPPATGVESVYGRLRALVVDDIATNRFVVGQLLDALRIDYAEADSGTEALEWLKAEPFDLVLLDMNMPGVDGVATFQSIRGSGQNWADIPVIALTADALPDQREKYIALGINGYVTKPVDKRLLWSEILSTVRPPPPL
ncbi:MAG: response regulator [Rhodobacteraceae bacterium]|nr:response regulator [Paracoccaceae bacterium]